MPKINATEKKTMSIAFLAIMVLLGVYILHDPLHAFYNPKNHLAIHIALEFFSISISFSIFIYGWLTFRHFQSQQLIFISTIFLAVGLLDLLHTLTYSGMPFFITGSSIAKSASFWLVARFTEAAFLLLVLVLSKRKSDADYRPYLLTVAISYVTVITFLIFKFEHALPIWVVEGQGTTPLKNGIEYVISFLHLLAIIIAVKYYRRNQNPAEIYIALALFFLLICELIFTVFQSIYDFTNFLGHIYKVVGYYYILKGFYFTAIEEPFTQNKLIKDTLNMTQQQFKAMLEHTADGIILVDLNKKIIHVNPAFEKMFNYNSNELIGKEIPIIPPERNEEIVQQFKQLDSGISIVDFETERQAKDGSMIQVSLTTSPIKDGNGDIIFYSSIIRDIRHRKQTEELLVKSEKLAVVGQLSAGFAHEIRNPLTTIKGFTQLIETEVTNINPLYIDLIKAELERIELITNEFMTVAKPQAVQFKVESIVDLISDVTKFMLPQTLMYNVQIFTNIEGIIPKINCEPNQLKQVFINLLKNAIESMPNGGNININISQLNEKYVSISFTDQGCGIPAEIIPRLGEPFYSLKEKGTGLGLMVSYKIIEEHRGEIKIDTEVETGSTFTVLLPLHF